MHRRTPPSTPFPYTTLFRSVHLLDRAPYHRRPKPRRAHPHAAVSVIHLGACDRLHRGGHGAWLPAPRGCHGARCTSRDRKSTRLNSSHLVISYAVFCLKKKI